MPLNNLPLELFAIAVILAAGATVFCAIVRDLGYYARWERIAYCYPLGLAALGMPMFLLSYFGVHLNTVVITGIVIVSLVVVAVMRHVSPREFWQAGANARQPVQPFTEFEWLLLVIIVLSLGARTVASLLAPLNDWDGVCVWGIKAKIVFYNTVKTSDYFYKPEYAFSHPNYPLLWPFMYAWVCTVLGNWDDLGMLILNPVNMIVFSALMYWTLRRYVARTVALAVTAIMASLPALLHYAECGQADVTLMLISGASLFCLFDWMNHRRRDSLWLSAFLMGGALFTKQEGKILLVALLCAGMLSVWLGEAPGSRKKRVGQLALFAGIAVVWALPWLLFERGIKNYASDFGDAGISTFRWNQIPTLCGTIMGNAFHFYNQVHLPKWNFLWAILGFALLTQKTWRHNPWICLLVVFVIHAAAIGILFLASSVELTLQAMEIAFERFTLVMLPPLWLLLAKCADEAWTVWKTSPSPDGQPSSHAANRGGSQRTIAR
jgi:dolichyl-phosphate-mannose-protein mannosyltransferase